MSQERQKTSQAEEPPELLTSYSFPTGLPPFQKRKAAQHVILYNLVLTTADCYGTFISGEFYLLDH